MRRIKMSAMAQSGHLGAADNCPLLGAKRTLRGPVSTRINYRVKESRRVLREMWDKADREIDQQTGRGGAAQKFWVAHHQEKNMLF